MFSISHVGYDCPIPSCLSNFSPISYHPIPFFSYSIWVFHYLNFFYFLFSFFFSSLPLNCLSFPCSMRLSFFVPSTDILVLHLYFLSIVLLHFCPPIPFYSFSFWVFVLFVSFTFCFSFFLPSFKLWVSFTMIIISPKDNRAYG